MISLLEKLFRRQMRNYWYSGHETGRVYGLNQAKALIHSEIKMLQKVKVDKSKNDARILELKYMLNQIGRIL
jgi:hypothetical protein